MSNHTVIHKLSRTAGNNSIFFKREDLLPFSFGGNKARKAVLYFEEINRLGCDTIVTYGSACSNHCRVIANIAAANDLHCVIINPEEDNGINTCNRTMIKIFGAQIIFCPVSKVGETIEQTMNALLESHAKPYYIEGGGHGNIGTQAYVTCYEEVCAYEKSNKVSFDYIFHASGTGTTQAGLVCGCMMGSGRQKIIGISIARQSKHGRGVITKCVADYFTSINREVSETDVNNATYFVDTYICGGYGNYNPGIISTIKSVLSYEGVALDPTYTGKAFWGMKEYIRKHNINGKNILFIHTGGQPIFFDTLGGLL